MGLLEISPKINKMVKMIKNNQMIKMIKINQMIKTIKNNQMIRERMGKQSTQPSPSYLTPAVPMEGEACWTI